MNKKICVISSSRADYGLLYWLLHDMHHDDDIDLHLWATGSHLEEKYGNTYQEIIQSGIPISDKIPINLSCDTPEGIAASMAIALTKFTDLYKKTRPDLLILLGDRFEILSAATAAMLTQIPIAHIHGGEVTQGVIDDNIRHAITKMAHMHFCASDIYKNRIIQLGENPKNVHFVGACGIENIRRLSFLSKQELESRMKMNIRAPLFVVTFHPETIHPLSPREQIIPLLQGLESFPTANIIITGHNADLYAGQINQPLFDFVEKNKRRVLYKESLGSLIYLSLLSHASCVIGNSSSGILEAPAMGCPSVNIGNRQRGRARAPSVIDCALDGDAIIKAIQMALSDEHQKIVASKNHPFGDGHVASKIIKIIKSTNFNDLLQKEFYDII